VSMRQPAATPQQPSGNKVLYRDGLRDLAEGHVAGGIVAGGIAGKEWGAVHLSVRDVSSGKGLSSRRQALDRVGGWRGLQEAVDVIDVERRGHRLTRWQGRESRLET
jgi:hypothetical protein